MEIDRKELKRQARERMALTDPKFWVVALVYIAMTTGVSWLFSLVPTSGAEASPVPFIDTLQLFLQLLLILYTAVVQFGLCLWALWTYRQLDPGVNSLMQGFSVAGRVLLMELGIYLRTMGWYLCLALLLSVPVIPILLTATSEFTYIAVLLFFAAGLIAVLIVLKLRYALAPYLLADSPDDRPTAHIFRSVGLMRGWKWELFKLEFSFLGYDLVNLVLTLGVTLFFLRSAGLLTPNFFTDEALRAQVLDLIYSAPVVIFSTLVTIPLSLWLIPYRSVARAGFYDARLQAASQDAPPMPEMPPL